MACHSRQPGHRAHANDLLGDVDTKTVEAIATLYAAWNDALLGGVAPTDDFIITAVLNDWHPEKAKKFKPRPPARGAPRADRYARLR